MRARGNSQGPSTEDVLRRGRATAAELIELIRKENPTGRGLPRRAENERYRRKSALQSLLIERYATDIALVRDGATEIVTIRHRLLDADACHAVLGDLSEEARSIALRTLDLDDADGDAPPEPQRTRAQRKKQTQATEDRASLSKGDACLDEYDYEGARSNYSAAWSETSSTQAALRLLSLFVDHMAADDDAITFASSLPTSVSSSPELRALAALAFARQGHRAEADRWLHGADDRRSADALASLALAATQADDLDAASSYAKRATRADAASPMVLRAVEVVERAADAELAALEVALDATKAGGDRAATELQARQTLARHPKSRIAREVLAGLEAERHRAAIRALLDHGLRLADEGQTRAALDALGQLASTALEPEERERAAAATARLEFRIASEERRVRLEDATNAVLRTPWSLGGYLALDAEERALVRASVSMDALELAERMYTARRNLSPTDVEATVAAVAGARAATSDAAALGLLEPYRSVLMRLPELAAWLEALRDRKAVEDRETDEEILRKARAAYRNQDWEALVVMLEGVRPQTLTPCERSELDAISHDLELAVHEAKAMDDYFARCAAGDPEAFAIAREHAESAPLGLGKRWSSALDEGRILLDARLHFLEAPPDPDETPGGRLVVPDACGQASSPDHDAIVLASVVGAHLIVRLFSSSTGGLRHTVSLTLDVPRKCAGVRIKDALVRVFIENGSVVELALPDLTLVGRKELRRCMDFDIAWLHPSWDGEHMWVLGRRSSIRAIRVHERRARATIEGRHPIKVVPGPRGGMLSCPVAGAVQEVMSPSGSALGLRLPLRTDTATVHPSGEGLVTFESDYVNQGLTRKFLISKSRSGKEQRRLTVDGLEGTNPVLSTSLNERLVFLEEPSSEHRTVIAFSDDPGHGLRELWNVEVPKYVSLLGDAECSEVYAFDPSRPGGACRLTREPPTVFGIPRGVPRFLRLDGLGRCPHAFQRFSSDVHEVFRALDSNVPMTVAEAIRIGGGGDAVRALLNAAYVMELHDRKPEADALYEELDTTYSNDPRLSFFRAEHAIYSGDWSRATSQLDRLQGAELIAEQRAHLHHLRAIVGFARADTDAVVRAVAALARDAGSCDFTACQRMALVLGAARADEEDDVRDARELLAAYRRADRHIERGDFRAALREVDDPRLWSTRETQAFARTAQAAMLWHPATDAERVERRQLLVRSASALAGRDWTFRCVMVPGAFVPFEELQLRGKAALRAHHVDLDEQRATATRALTEPTEVTPPSLRARNARRVTELSPSHWRVDICALP